MELAVKVSSELSARCNDSRFYYSACGHHQCLIPPYHQDSGWTSNTRFFFNKKLGSAPSTKSFLISHENFAIIVLKVS